MSHYFPVEYLTATLNSFLSKADRIKQFMTVCKNRGIPVLSPDVNYSMSDFAVDEKSIRFGFAGIRNMGSYGDLIIREREENGLFTNLYNFIERMASSHGINRTRIEALIYAGALDSFPGTRLEKLNMVDVFTGVASVVKADKANGTKTLISSPLFSPIYQMLFDMKGIKEMTEKVRLEKEREYTGFYVSGHPLDQYELVFKNPKIKNFFSIQQILPNAIESEDALSENDLDIENAFAGEMVRIAGVVQEMEVRETRNHQQMANITIEDVSGSVKAILFPTIYSQNIQRVRNGEVLAFYGKIEVSEFGTQFLVNGIETMDELMTTDSVAKMTLYLSNEDVIARHEFETVMDILKTNAAENTVPVQVVLNGKTYSTRKGSPILGNTKLATIVRLQELLGRHGLTVHFK